MPTLNRAPNEKELEKLISIFLKAETDIINEIGRLRSQGNVDYHAVAALERVQAILKQLETDSWEYVPQMVERQFYARVPEARKILEPAAKHLAGYAHAEALTATQHSVVDRLVTNLMGEIVEASTVALASLENVLLGRREEDVFRRAGLGAVALGQALGQGTRQTAQEIFNTLAREGVTAFVDKAGRRWSLHTYCSMVARTTSRQAEVLAVLTADESHDLYKISSHNTPCKICAPLEGRVYSKSGRDPDFPPLAAAFGKVDPNGPEDLSNTWLNIHPNCLHVLMPWTSAGRSEEEIQQTKEFSSFQTNPPSVDPRTQKQIEAYRKKEKARADWLRNYRQWEKYRIELGDQVPKTFATFQKHKQAGDAKYENWKKEYTRLTRNYDIIKEKRAEGTLNLLINKGNQNKHIQSAKGYIEGRSYIYGGLEEAQRLVNAYSGTGVPKFDSKGRWTRKEFVTLDKPVGVDIDLETGTPQETNRFTIHYGKKGTHIVPAKRER